MCCIVLLSYNVIIMVRLPTRRVTTMTSLQLATLEMRKELEPKYNPQLFLGEVAGTKSWDFMGVVMPTKLWWLIWKKRKLNRSRIVPTPFVHIYIPYYRKLRLHEIKVLEINATQINANLMANDFRIKKINAKEEVEFHNKGN